MGKLLIVSSVLVRVLSRQLADEFKAWTPWLVQRLVQFAAGRMPVAQRERYAEEWSSFVDEIPGEVGKILSALGLPWAGFRIRNQARKRQRVAEGSARQGKNTVLVVLLLIPVFVRLWIRKALVQRGLLSEPPKTFGIDNDVLVILIIGIFAFWRHSLQLNQAKESSAAG